MQIEVPKFFKDYNGTLSEFQTGLAALQASQVAADQAKYTEIMNSIVFIHDTYGGECIFAKGNYYNAASSSGGGGGVYKIQMNSVPTSAQELAGITTAIQTAYRPDYTPANGHVCIVEVASQVESDRPAGVDDDGLTTTRPITYLTYVYSSNAWHAVDVAADHIYFYNGINRTTAWGVKTAPPSMVTECTGMNLQQLLNYFLVTETKPTVSASWNCRKPTISVAFANTTPTVRLTYSKPASGASGASGGQQTATAESGTIVCNAFYSVAYGNGTDGGDISWSSRVNITSPASVTHGPATVTGLTYGGEADGDKASFSGTTITGNSSLTYTRQSIGENNTATGQLKLTYNSVTLGSAGQAQIINSTGNNSTVEDGTFYPTIGSKTFSASIVLANTPATFTFAYKGNNDNGDGKEHLIGVGDSKYMSNIGEKYFITNQASYYNDNVYVSTDNEVITEEVLVPYYKDTRSLSTAPTAKSITVDAVLPIFTNGTPGYVSATSGTGTATPGAAYDSYMAYTHTDTTKTETGITKLTQHTTLLDYASSGFNSSNTRFLMIGFGNTDNCAAGSLIYVPAGMNIYQAYTTSTANKMESQDSGYSNWRTAHDSKPAYTPTTTNITVNGKTFEYKVYQFKPGDPQGAMHVLIEFRKA